MADKKAKPKDKQTAAMKKEQMPKNAQKFQSKGADAPSAAKSSRSKTAIMVVIALIVIAAAILFVYPSILVSSVPFSTFKSGMQASPRISITATYSNQSQLANESACFTSMIQVISNSRKPSTIDFAIIDKATNVCTYSSTGLGGSVNPVTTNASSCLQKAYGEEGIFLNYSAVNYTTITASRMYVYGNDAYLEKCPIAIELS